MGLEEIFEKIFGWFIEFLPKRQLTDEEVTALKRHERFYRINSDPVVKKEILDGYGKELKKLRFRRGDVSEYNLRLEALKLEFLGYNREYEREKSLNMLRRMP